MVNLWLISAMLVLIDVPITSQLYADFSADSFVSWNQRNAKEKSEKCKREIREMQKRKKFFNLLAVEALHSNEMVKQSKNKLFGGMQASVSLEKIFSLGLISTLPLFLKDNWAKVVT